MKMFEFLADQSILIFFVIFVIFIVIAYKLVKFLFKAFIIGLVAAIFPVVGNLVLGLNIEISFFNILWFAVTGIGLFVLYSIVRTGWKFLRVLTKPFRWARRPTKEKKQKPQKAEKTESD
jgi:hypothetical protein